MSTTTSSDELKLWHLWTNIGEDVVDEYRDTLLRDVRKEGDRPCRHKKLWHETRSHDWVDGTTNHYRFRYCRRCCVAWWKEIAEAEKKLIDEHHNA